MIAPPTIPPLAFALGQLSSTGRGGRSHGCQIRRREAAHQARHDTVVLGRLAPGARRTLPAGVRRVDAPEHATTALVFADDAASLRDLLATHQERLARLDILWVATQGQPDRYQPGQPVAVPQRARTATGDSG